MSHSENDEQKHPHHPTPGDPPSPIGDPDSFAELNELFDSSVDGDKSVQDDEHTTQEVGAWSADFDMPSDLELESREANFSQPQAGSIDDDPGFSDLSSGPSLTKEGGTVSDNLGLNGEGLSDLSEFGELSEGGDFGSLSDESTTEAELQDIGGKRAKSRKKPKKEKTSPPKRAPRSGVDWLVMLVNYFFVGVIVLGNGWGILLAKEISLVFFLVGFNLLGAILLFVPYLLAAKKRRDGAITFYDSLLAVSLALLIFCCMTLVAAQSKYGTQIKATSAALTNNGERA